MEAAWHFMTLPRKLRTDTFSHELPAYNVDKGNLIEVISSINIYFLRSLVNNAKLWRILNKDGRTAIVATLKEPVSSTDKQAIDVLRTYKM